jgi:hypothetical protein
MHAWAAAAAAAAAESLNRELTLVQKLNILYCKSVQEY